MAQFFKGDARELKFYDSANPLLTVLELEKDEFFLDSYKASPLGDLIIQDDRSPLSQAIDPSIFRDAFPEIFNAFIRVGTFEAYLDVFRKIFGETVGINFVVPGPGLLEINILADEVELFNLVARRIQANQFIFEEIIDHVGDNIALQSIKGFKTQYELEQMLFEMVPAGVSTTINLSFGVE